MQIVPGRRTASRKVGLPVSLLPLPGQVFVQQLLRGVGFLGQLPDEEVGRHVPILRHHMQAGLHTRRRIPGGGVPVVVVVVVVGAVPSADLSLAVRSLGSTGAAGVVSPAVAGVQAAPQHRLTTACVTAEPPLPHELLRTELEPLHLGRKGDDGDDADHHRRHRRRRHHHHQHLRRRHHHHRRRRRRPRRCCCCRRDHHHRFTKESYWI